MNIRTWLGYNNPLVQFSQVDKKVDSILTYFHKIALNFVNESELSSITALELSLKDEKSERDIYIGFKNWFFEEGKDFLISSGKNLYADNAMLCEELEYLEFVISTESSSIDEYPEELIGILIDVSDQFNELLEDAQIVDILEMKKTHTFSHLDDGFLNSYYQKRWILNNLNYWDDSKGQDSYNKSKSLFFV